MNEQQEELVRRVGSFYEAGRSLGKLCRWCGRGDFYPVLAHSLVCGTLCYDDDPMLELVGLLHDVSDSVHADVPTPCKTAGQKALELEMRDAQMRHLGVEPPAAMFWDRVHVADQRAKAAEWRLVGPREAGPLGVLPEPDGRALELTAEQAARPVGDWLYGRAAIEYHRRCVAAYERLDGCLVGAKG